MATQTARGFTIIETMLFLAVTGLLTVGVLVGSGAAIAQQRYKDSVNSLKSFIQDQYGETMSVVDSKAQNPACRRLGSSLSFDNGSSRPRGTSDCLLLGRHVVITPTKVTAYSVLGQPPVNPTDTDDIGTLQSYTLGRSDAVDSRDIAWGATVVAPGSSTGVTTSLLILRSPLSGSILTFVADGERQPSAMLLPGGSTMNEKDLCVDGQDGLITSRRLAVRINANATSQSSVEIPLEGDTACE